MRTSSCLPFSGLKRRTPSSVESDEPAATLCGTMSVKWAGPFLERTAESVTGTPSCTCAFAVDTLGGLLVCGSFNLPLVRRADRDDGERIARLVRERGDRGRHLRDARVGAEERRELLRRLLGRSPATGRSRRRCCASSSERSPGSTSGASSWRSRCLPSRYDVFDASPVMSPALRTSTEMVLCGSFGVFPLPPLCAWCTAGTTGWRNPWTARATASGEACSSSAPPAVVKFVRSWVGIEFRSRWPAGRPMRRPRYDLDLVAASGLPAPPSRSRGSPSRRR